MNPSGEGLQVQNTGVTSMQDYLRQKEELRRLKGIIEAAERSMDLQLAGQMQPILAAVPQQAVAPGRYVYPPGSLPALSLSVPRPPSPMAQETARIVEIDSHPSPPNQTSTVSTYKLTNDTESYQGYTQPGRTNPTPSNMFSQPGPSNAHSYEQPLSSMNYTHERPVQSSSSQYNQPLINSHSQVTLYDTSYQRNQAQIHSRHTGSIRPNLHGHQESLYPIQAFQSGSSTAKQYSSQDQQSVKQMQVSNLQRTLPNGEAPVGNPSPFVPRSHMQSSDMHRFPRSMQNRDYVPPHGNFSYVPPHDNLGSLEGPYNTRDSRGATNTLEQSTSTSVSIPGRKTPIPISHIMSGTGTTPALNGSHQESGNSSFNHHPIPPLPDALSLVPPRHQGIPGPMDGAEVPSAPVQSPSSLNDPASIQSNLSSSYVEPANPETPAGQTDTNVTEKPQLSALSMLTEILANHEQWREEASSRIIQQAMGSHSVPKNVREDESIGDQSYIRLNAVASSSERPETQQVAQTAVFSSDIQEPQPRTLHVHAPPSAVENNDIIEKADVGTAKSMPEMSGVITLPSLRESVPHASSMTHDGVSYVSAAGPFLPRTPVRGDKPGHSSPGSAGADRKTLAKDILRALLPPSTKRKRDGVDTCEGTGLSTDHPVDSPTKKNKTSISDVSRELDRSLVNGDVPMHESKELGGPSTTTPSGVPLSQPHRIPVPSQVTDSQQTTSRQFPFLSPQQQPAPPQTAGPSRMMTQGTIPLQQPGQPWAPGSWNMGSYSQYTPYYPRWEPRVWPPISQPSNSATHPSISQRAPPPRQHTQDSLGSSNKKSRVKPPSAKEQIMSKQPLFLPSSESPPASPNIRPSQTNHVLQEGRGISLPKSKPIVEISSPRAISKAAGFSPALLDANTSGEMFGRPTGVLAAASAAIPRVGARPSRSQPYVLVPQVDKGLWLVSVHGQTRSSKGKASDSLPIQSGADIIPDDDEEENQNRARDFARRLVRRPCLWKDCQAMLDSGEKLTKHVKILHGKENENMLYVCRWKECQSTRAFPDSEKLIRHLQWHVSSRIYCGYRGCSFQTQLAVQLSVHVTEYHSDRDGLRPYAVPFGLVMAQGLPKLVDDTLPTYMSVPIPVSPREISRDRHQKIGPWVLRHIFGKVAINKGAVSAAVPLRSQRLLEKQEFSMPTDELYQQVQRKFKPQDEYDFLKKEGVTKSFAPLALLPLTIDDLEVTEETELDLGNAEPSKPETSVDVVGESAIQDPVRSEGATELDLPNAEPFTVDVVGDSAIQGPARFERVTELDLPNAEPSEPQRSVDVVGDSVIQDPVRFEGATRGGSEQLGLTATMDVGNAQTVPSGVVLGPAHEADEVEGLL